MVTYEDGQNIANEIGAKKFIECSAKTWENVEEVFLKSAEQIMLIRKKIQEKPCWFRRILFCGLCC